MTAAKKPTIQEPATMNVQGTKNLLGIMVYRINDAAMSALSTIANHVDGDILTGIGQLLTHQVRLCRKPVRLDIELTGLGDKRTYVINFKFPHNTRREHSAKLANAWAQDVERALKALGIKSAEHDAESFCVRLDAAEFMEFYAKAAATTAKAMCTESVTFEEEAGDALFDSLTQPSFLQRLEEGRLAAASRKRR